MTRPHLPPIHEWTFSSTAPFQGRYAISLARAGVAAPRPYAGVALEYSGPLGGRDALWEVYLYGTLPSDPVNPLEARPRPVLGHGPAVGLREAVERAERQLAADVTAPSAPARRPGKPTHAPSRAAKAAPKARKAPARGRARQKTNGPGFTPLRPGVSAPCGSAPRRR